MAQFQQLHPLHQMDQKAPIASQKEVCFLLKEIGLNYVGFQFWEKEIFVPKIVDEFVWWIGPSCRVSWTI